MKPAIDLYWGAPIDVESEQLFLAKLSTDLLAQQQSALVFANFFPSRKPVQIDFLVVTAQCACHLELKNLTAPVVGKINGPWSLRMPDGSLSPLEAKNPYRQALDGKFSISDEMHAFATSNPSIPRPAEGKFYEGKFYKHLESVVCVFPELLPGSSVHQDHKVRVKGYRELLAFLATSRTNPRWTKDHWTAFAMHLGLVRVEGEGDRTPPETRAAQQATAEYARRFEDFYGRDLPTIVPTSIETKDGIVASDALIDGLLRGEHIQLVGPAGCGKSLLAKHMAIAAVHGGRLPIVVPTREYDGKLSALLDRSVAHLYPDTALQFVSAAARVGRPIALILDGFNECPPKRREELLKDLQAFLLRRQVPVLITAQEAVPLPEPLAGRLWRFAPLRDEQKLAVLRSYAGDGLPANIEAMAEPFQTPYELSLAAACLAEPGAVGSRAALFEAYTRRRCSTTPDVAIAHGILCAIADRMRRQLVSSLPVSEIWRVAEEALGREHAPMRLLTPVLDCGLLDVRQGRCAFRHELIERFFQAEALVREHASGGNLPRALTTPRNRELIEFILGIKADPEAIRSCLEAVADPAVVADCVRGRYGQVARDAATEDLSRVLRAAERSLEDTDVQLTGDEDWKRLVVNDGPRWSVYDRALLEAVGRVLPDGLFLDEAFRLVARTERRCHSALAERAGTSGSLAPGDAQHLFAALYVFTPADGHFCLPASTIYHASRFRFKRAGVAAVHEVLLRVAGSLESRTSGELLLLCEMLRFSDQELSPIVPQLLRACWRTGIYHLRLDALQMAEWSARSLEGETRTEVQRFLATLHSNNLGLSTAIVEALLAYDMVQSPVSADDATRDLAEILETPEDAGAQERAYHAVANIFEDIYQGAYWDAIETLPHDDRVRLLTMAALGAPSYGFFTDWILEELLRRRDQRALPAFLRWAASIDTESCFPQGAITCYVLGLVGCARYLEAPPPFAKPRRDVKMVWQAYGVILFWLYRPGLSHPERKAAAAPCWERLRSEWSLEAVDPLLQLELAGRKADQGNHGALQDLCATFPDDVRGILEFGLINRARLTDALGRMPFRERISSLIRWLGVVGNHRTVRLLELIVDTPELGPYALEAIRKLKNSSSS